LLLQTLPNTIKKCFLIKKESALTQIHPLGKKTSAIIQRALPPPQVSIVSKELEIILQCLLI
jgi:hypothetical protein